MNNIYLFVSIKSYQTILYTKVCTESKGRLLLYQDLNMAGIRKINHYVQVPTRVASHHLLQGRERKESKVSAFQGWEKSHYNIADYHISVIISQGIRSRSSLLPPLLNHFLQLIIILFNYQCSTHIQISSTRPYHDPTRQQSSNLDYPALVPTWPLVHFVYVRSHRYIHSSYSALN